MLAWMIVGSWLKGGFEGKFLIAMLLVYVIWEISEGRIVGTVFELSNRFVSRIVTLRERGGVPRYLGLGT